MKQIIKNKIKCLFSTLLIIIAFGALVPQASASLQHWTGILSYTVPNNNTISIPYTVVNDHIITTCSSLLNGTIRPSGPQTYADGSAQQYIITPASGYTINTV